MDRGRVSTAKIFEDSRNIGKQQKRVGLQFRRQQCRCAIFVDHSFDTAKFPLSANDWDPAATELFDEDEDGIYSITLEVQDDPLEFKFINGNGWGEGIQEVVPEACGVDDNNGAFNRTISNPGTADITYFAEFGACPTK